MLEAAKEALTDRIKTPIIGTYLLLFAFVNYLQFHPLIIHFKSIEKTQDAYGNLSIDWNTPATYTLIYVGLSALIKILNKNWDALVEKVDKTLLDWLSDFHRSKNLKKINNLHKEVDTLNNRVELAKTYFNSARSKSLAAFQILELTPQEDELLPGERPKRLSLTVDKKREARDLTNESINQIISGLNQIETNELHRNRWKR